MFAGLLSRLFMTLEEFRLLTSPAKLTKALQALWHDAHGDWDRAHELAQEASNPEGDWVHAYLHRKEGDEGNARYWYNRAGRVKSSQALDAEWLEIVQSLLKR
jgi:hypothetical protein